MVFSFKKLFQKKDEKIASELKERANTLLPQYETNVKKRILAGPSEDDAERDPGYYKRDARTTLAILRWLASKPGEQKSPVTPYEWPGDFVLRKDFRFIKDTAHGPTPVDFPERGRTNPKLFLDEVENLWHANKEQD